MLFSILCASVILLAVVFYMLRAKGKQEQKKFGGYSQTLLLTIQRNGVEMEPADIRIQFRDKKRVDYVLAVYEGKDVVTLKSIEKNLQKMVKEKFPNHQMRILTDFKRNSRRNPETA